MSGKGEALAGQIIAEMHRIQFARNLPNQLVAGSCIHAGICLRLEELDFQDVARWLQEVSRRYLVMMMTEGPPG